LRKIFYLALPIFFYLIYGLAIGFYRLAIFKSELEREHPQGYYDYRGAVHVHTSLSTGSGNIQDVVSAAKESALDFVVLTDLNLFPAFDLDRGYDGSVLVINGGEYSYLDSHLLYLDAPLDSRPQTVQNLSSIGQAQIYFSDLLSQERKDADSGVLILAHPYKARYRWSGEPPSGMDGIEVINLSSLWEHSWQESKVSTIWSFLIYFFNPDLALFRLYEEPREELELWDHISQSRPAIGIAGADATAKSYVLGNQSIRFPSYQRLFAIANNHVLLTSELTGTASSDRQKILTAIRNRQFYMSLDILADPKGFLAEIKDDKTSHPIGSIVKLKAGMQLRVRLPYRPEVPFETVVLKDGKRFVTSNSQETVMDIHVPGVYRVMVRIIPTLPLPDGKKWFPWIFTNAFYVN
jgi:hypothetical protein